MNPYLEAEQFILSAHHLLNKGATASCIKELQRALACVRLIDSETTKPYAIEPDDDSKTTAEFIPPDRGDGEQ